MPKSKKQKSKIENKEYLNKKKSREEDSKLNNIENKNQNNELINNKEKSKKLIEKPVQRAGVRRLQSLPKS